MMAVLGPAGVAFVAFAGLLLTMAGLVGVLAGTPREEPYVFFSGLICGLLGGGMLVLLCRGIA